MKRNRNNQGYKIIDTTKVYKLTSILNIQGKDSTYLKETKKYFLKFYADGKVGQFFNYNHINLNPKKATIDIQKES